MDNPNPTASLTLDEKRMEVSRLRNEAKILFGESLQRPNYLNPDFPMARFVDTLIDVAVLQLEVRLADLGEGVPV